jgi:hypothetical protein
MGEQRMKIFGSACLKLIDIRVASGSDSSIDDKASLKASRENGFTMQPLIV